ncbi:MAG: GNAT family N-acetyltransferase [Actinomycetota bacterium]|nr:GNAT family N-acetyltransferase [Actinomycetota bacterium]
MSETTSTAVAEAVTLREVKPEDAKECARICFEAFGGIDDHHRFPRSFPSLEFAEGLMQAFVGSPLTWGVVAERDGRIVGSNFLHEGDPIGGVGPISVDPDHQSGGVGRKLMEAVIERGKGAPGTRLLQDSYNMLSLSLYASLGFEEREPVVRMSGKPANGPVEGIEVRPLREADLDECGTLCKKVHGFERTNELRAAMHAFAPYVALRDGRVSAYSTTLTFWPMAHGVAETDEDMQALLRGVAAAVEDPLAILVPLRSGLFHSCLSEGLRSLKPMNLMTLGSYQEPHGSWFPSVLY